MLHGVCKTLRVAPLSVTGTPALRVCAPAAPAAPRPPCCHCCPTPTLLPLLPRAHPAALLAPAAPRPPAVPCCLAGCRSAPGALHVPLHHHRQQGQRQRRGRGVHGRAQAHAGCARRGAGLDRAGRCVACTGQLVDCNRVSSKYDDSLSQCLFEMFLGRRNTHRAAHAAVVLCASPAFATCSACEE